MKTQRLHSLPLGDKGKPDQEPGRPKRTRTLLGMPAMKVGPNGTPVLVPTAAQPQPDVPQPDSVQQRARSALLRTFQGVEERESPFAKLQIEIRQLAEGEPNDRSYDKYFSLVDRIKFLRSKEKLSDEAAYRLIHLLEKIVPHISAELINESASLVLRLKQEIEEIQEGQGYRRYYEVLNDILVARGRKSLSDNTAHELIQLLNSKRFDLNR